MFKMVKKQIIQPEINIGLVGHVDHGKSTLVYALSGKVTDTHSEEIKRGITIRLGYADSSFYKCKKCKEPDCYSSNEKCDICKGKCDFLRKVSFVDAPGHESLMATMLSGASIMDGALLIIGANEKCPQPQTKEHLMALEIANIKNIVVVQNKIDLVSEKEALENYNQIKEFLKNTIAEKAPIIPVSAQHNVNISALIAAIQKYLPTPKRDLKERPLMFVARSFDVNKPGISVDKLVGGVLGGALINGKLKVNDEIEIRPGLKSEEYGRVNWNPINTKIVELKTGGTSVDEVVPGGTIGLMTELDPGMVKADSLIGKVVGLKGGMPEVWNDLKLKVKLLDKVVGVEKEMTVEPLKIAENLMINVNSATTVGIISELSKGAIKLKLKLPVCADKGSKAALSRLVGTRWRLIGSGEVV